MAVNSLGEVAGSVSGGCVEAAVVEECLSAIADHQPRFLTYGVADELGFSVGLTCGGTIHIFVQYWQETLPGTLIPASAVFEAVHRSEQVPFALCTLVSGKNTGAKLLVTSQGEGLASLGNPHLDRAVSQTAQGLLAQGQNQLTYYGEQGERRLMEVGIFIQSLIAPPQMMIFGAVNFTRSLARLGKMLGYQVIICDARSRFATPERFPEADQIVVEWPHKYLETARVDSRTLIAVLTHDPKFDVPALVQAVQTPAGYIGAMGSRKASADRIVRLREAGLSEAQIDRISAPLGLDIGARTAEETAVSIMAEVIALRSGRAGERLMHNQNAIHPR
jgi:xanthine dehydrogenase accessory factor